MATDTNTTDMRIAEIEAAMQQPDFWNNPEKAQALIREMQELKDAAAGVGKYDRGNAIISILSGAGGDDAEDFTRMLFDMYRKYIEARGWSATILEENVTSAGYRNISFEVTGKRAYGTLKHESGVHRLVRISPFNAQGKRQTSFSLVEVVPVLPDVHELPLDESELDVQFARSSGPGGQNVNKRETAVRITHTPTGISVHVEHERSQAQNKEKALEILRGKVYKKREDDREKEARGFSISKEMKIEWGSQIRSYVLHPYKKVKDHRSDTETSDTDAVLDGDIELFINATSAQQ